MGEENLLYCYNKGCGTKFDPGENKSDSCLYHPGAPYFHDAYKIWSCCNQKSTDFSTWLSLKGCTRGQHSNQKSVVETKPEKETKAKSQTPEEVIVWSGLNKPAARQDALKIMTALKLEVTEGALKAIERFKSEVKEATEPDIRVGVSCKNPGCDKCDSVLLCYYNSLGHQKLNFFYSAQFLDL
ncbi:unnamed protein product [Litomosoides sigmodontis]|uniref:CHORD domain-containing protein n=1 Tax=Litomosoides sigmodontis TaxID=42156 RepID=A0A3P6U0N1_LITSI|nr:unnamed protein product [Litomosoides sigmodontis]